MSRKRFEIRICESCGLRYPFVDGHPHGARCPVCTGGTRVVLSRELILEPDLTVYPSLDGRGESAVLLDNIRSAWNVGSILRSAEGFGFAHAYLCGITPTPENDAVQKTSLGAEDSVTWSHHKDAVKLVRGLRKEGWKIYALEQDAKAVPISNAETSTPRRVLIVGSEVTGVDSSLLDLSDEIFHIPMFGGRKSFNAAIAFGIAAYAVSVSR